MSALTLSSIIFVLMLSGIFLGTLLRRGLPEHHLDEHAKDVVRLGVGLIATIAALVLGLLIAAAKSSFDTQTGQLRQITADLILLDNILAQYGPEARPVREQMRSTVGPFADRLWREKEPARTGPFEPNAAEDQVYSEIQKLSPHSDVQRLPYTLRCRLENALGKHRGSPFGPERSPSVVKNLPQEADSCEIEIRRLFAVHDTSRAVTRACSAKWTIVWRLDDSLISGEL